MEKFIVGLVFIGIIVGFFALGSAVQSASCGWRWEGYQTKYSVFNGCKVLIDGKYIPEENVRIGN